MSVKIEWQIFTAETQGDGTWRSNSPTLEELLNIIASPNRVKENTLDLEYGMARLAIKSLPYFKISEVTTESNRAKKLIRSPSGNTCWSNGWLRFIKENSYLFSSIFQKNVSLYYLIGIIFVIIGLNFKAVITFLALAYLIELNKRKQPTRMPKERKFIL